jgi:hypothetical protein
MPLRDEAFLLPALQTHPSNPEKDECHDVPLTDG